MAKKVGKKEWARKHGTRPHQPAFAELGWKWTPVVCRCPSPCVLDTSQRS